MDINSLFLVQFRYNMAQKPNNAHWEELFEFSDDSLDLTMDDDGQLSILFDDTRWALYEVSPATNTSPAIYKTWE